MVNALYEQSKIVFIGCDREKESNDHNTYLVLNTHYVPTTALDDLYQALADYGLWATPVVFFDSFIATHPIYDCSCATVAELSKFDRLYVLQSIFTIIKYLLS